MLCQLLTEVGPFLPFYSVLTTLHEERGSVFIFWARLLEPMGLAQVCWRVAGPPLGRWLVYRSPLSSLIYPAPLPRRRSVGNDHFLFPPVLLLWQITGGLWTDWPPAQHLAVIEGFISPASGVCWTPQRLTLSTAQESLGLQFSL